MFRSLFRRLFSRTPTSEWEAAWEEYCRNEQAYRKLAGLAYRQPADKSAPAVKVRQNTCGSPRANQG
jgi:hypothetical protein